MSVRNVQIRNPGQIFDIVNVVNIETKAVDFAVVSRNKALQNVENFKRFDARTMRVFSRRVRFFVRKQNWQINIDQPQKLGQVVDTLVAL